MVPAALSAFALVAVPVAVFVAIWAAVTVYRLLVPKRPPVGRKKAARRGSVGVGYREIHAVTRRHARALPDAGGCPRGVPEAWIEDLQRRQN